MSQKDEAQERCARVVGSTEGRRCRKADQEGSGALMPVSALVMRHAELPSTVCDSVTIVKDEARLTLVSSENAMVIVCAVVMERVNGP